MRLVRLLSLPYFAKHRLRSLLTLAGIALGVAVLVAMYEANQSVLAGLRQTIAQIAGAADLQVSAGDTGIPEELLDRVRSVRAGWLRLTGGGSRGGHGPERAGQPARPGCGHDGGPGHSRVRLRRIGTG